MADSNNSIVKSVSIAVAVLLVFAIVSMIVYEIGFIDQTMVVGWNLTQKIIAGIITVIALVGAMAVVFRRDETVVRDIVPWLVIALAGTVLLEPNWGTGLGLGLAIAALVWFSRPEKENKEMNDKPPARKPRRSRPRSRSPKSGAKK